MVPVPPGLAPSKAGGDLAAGIDVEVDWMMPLYRAPAFSSAADQTQEGRALLRRVLQIVVAGSRVAWARRCGPVQRRG